MGGRRPTRVSVPRRPEADGVGPRLRGRGGDRAQRHARAAQGGARGARGLRRLARAGGSRRGPTLARRLLVSARRHLAAPTREAWTDGHAPGAVARGARGGPSRRRGADRPHLVAPPGRRARTDRAWPARVLRRNASSAGLQPPVNLGKVDLEAVVGQLEPAVHGELVRPMRQEQALGAGGAEGIDRLLDGQVSARLAVELWSFERRLADEEIAAARELGEPLAGP